MSLGMSFRSQMILVVACAQLVLLAASAFSNYQMTRQSLREEFASRVEVLSATAVEIAGEKLLHHGQNELATFFQDWAKKNELAFLQVLDDGMTIYKYGERPGSSTDYMALASLQDNHEIFETFSTVEVRDKEYELNIGISFSGLNASLEAHFRAQILWSVVQLFITGFFLVILSQIFVRRLGPLTEACRKVADGDLEVNLPVRRSDEIGEVSEAFNLMSKTLRESIRERELQRQKIVESSKLRALGEMAGGVAHEINNPLTIIEGNVDYIEYLAEGIDPDRKKAVDERLQRIRKTVDRISKIIQGLRRFARSGEAAPFEPVKLQTLIEDTLSLCQQRFVNHGVTIRVKNIPDATIPGREIQLSQVLINLLNNAFDAVESLSDRWVELDFSMDLESIRIFVTDSGKGIPAEIRNRVMEPFFTTKEIGKGTGIGLSISTGIIAEHRGRLWIDASHPNTRFVVELPLRTPQVSTPPSSGKAA